MNKAFNQDFRIHTNVELSMYKNRIQNDRNYKQIATNAIKIKKIFTWF